jgi:methylmalonyl-CoA/ethylmalonyl-CoA epimerase
MPRRVAHVGLAVKNLTEAIAAYSTLLDREPETVDEISDQKVRAAIYGLGETRIELLEAISEDSPIAKFIEKRGPGIHHICLKVDDIESELERLARAGMRLIDEKPRRGAEGCLIAFIHPKSTGGILVELNQDT